MGFLHQQVLNPTPLNPTPATCHKRKRKLRCSFRNAALQKLHCNIGFSAVRKSLGPEAVSVLQPLRGAVEVVVCLVAASMGRDGKRRNPRHP